MRIIPFSPPDIGEDEINAVCEVLRSGWITTGPKTKQFENELASYCGTQKSAALNSATAGMELILRILGIGKGDEVITSAYTYTASASVIHHVGAKIVLCDTAKDSFEMDYDVLETLITDKTKAVIAVDIGGMMCDYERIFEIVNRKASLFKPNNDIQRSFARCIVIADAAHSLGAIYKGRRSGAVADFTSFSFHAVKNLTTAEGGAVTWRNTDVLDNDELYRNFMLMSLHGQNKDALAKTKVGAWEYDIVAPLYKCNMTDIAAAMGLVQLARYDGILQLRHELINTYNSLLCDERFSSLMHKTDDRISSGHLYLLRINGINEQKRNEIINDLSQKGISTNVHYKPLPMLTAYKDLGFDIKDFPNAYEQFANEITLPLNTKMTVDDAEYVAKELLKLM
ncbi:MAG: DegT/DnrJ/EryC1/StrS family aminotransferase [Clostridia bacterium]|nr:DegT/DnrJ/EryC1/StrS family aminotransferase [Clostridia bacterium]